MAAIDIVNRVLREFKRYTGDGLPGEPINAPLPVGDPQSGVHNLKKAELREALLAPIIGGQEAAQAVIDANLPVILEAKADAALSAEAASDEADRAERAVADALAMIVPDDAVTFPKLASSLASAILTVIPTRTAMKALNTARCKVAYLNEAGREGAFIWREGNYSANIAADTQEGIYIKAGAVAATAGAWVRQYRGAADIMWFGASSANTDNTTAYNGAISALANGSEIYWPSAGAPWLGSFVSTNKAFKLFGNGNEVRNVVGANTYLLGFEGSIAQITTLTANAIYGDRTLTMTSTAGLAAGSIIMLEDDKARPSDSTRVNQEILKVKTVDSGTVVTVEDMVRSMQDSGIRRVHKIAPVIGASIKGFRGHVNNPWDGTSPFTNQHANRVFTFTNCEDGEYEDVYVENHYGRPIDFTQCYGGSCDGAAAVNAFNVSEGGYGVAAISCRKLVFRHLKTLKTRNGLDMSACYDVDFSDLDIEYPYGGAVGLSHNLYGGFVRGRRVRIVGEPTVSFGINVASQGIANPQNYKSRDISIEDVEFISTRPAASGGEVGVYFQCSVEDILIRNIKCRFPGAGDGLGNIGVRINGQVFGLSRLEGIKTEGAGVGTLVYVNGATGASGTVGLLRMANLHQDGAGVYIVYLTNTKHAQSHNVTCSARQSGGTINVNGSSPANVTNNQSGVLGLIN